MRPGRNALSVCVKYLITRNFIFSMDWSSKPPALCFWVTSSLVYKHLQNFMGRSYLFVFLPIRTCSINVFLNVLNNFNQCCLKMARIYVNERLRFLVMMALTTFGFLGEIIIGYIVHSTTLVASSFRLLADVCSLLIGYFAFKASAKLI